MEKASGWAIVAGCFLMLIGLCFLPAAFGEHADMTMLGSGLGIFSIGTLTTAGGIYLKARALQSAPATTPKTQTKRIRGGCDLCGTENPVIQCRVHQVHICGHCVARHYDFRTCAYVPSLRRSGPVKPAARFAAKA